MERAWEPVLFNDFPTSFVAATSTRPMNAMARYQLAAAPRGCSDRPRAGCAPSGDHPRGEGVPLVVLHAGAARARLWRAAPLAAGHETWDSLALFDANGSEVPLQLQNVKRHPDGGIRCADLIFIAQVPSLGYRTYFLCPGNGSRAPGSEVWVSLMGDQGFPGMVTGMLTPDEGRMGNGLIDVQANLRTGAILSLTLRSLDWNVVDGSHEHGFQLGVPPGRPWRSVGILWPAAWGGDHKGTAD